MLIKSVSQHQSLKPSYLILKNPPYKITCIGWGYFLIRILVTLKPDYLWREANGRVLPLQWMLDFDGMGSSASHEHAITVQGGKVRGDGKY